MTPLFALGFLSPQDILLLLVIGVLLFGRKLPEVGKYLGKGIVEFRKGLRGIDDEVEGSAAPKHDPTPIEQPRPPQRVATTAPKFEDSAANTPSTATTNSVPTPPKV